VAGAAPPTDRAYEAWLIAPGAAPVSLGLIGAEPLRVPYPDPPQGWTLAVSLEPAGGSPVGAPTGPVLAAGEINL
jgi:anti-sigma-K factor RskA